VLPKLLSVAGVTGQLARSESERIFDVEISWESALTNFRSVIKLYAGETVRYFPNSSKLSPDSFGALVSLVYNRGSGSEAKPNGPIRPTQRNERDKEALLNRKIRTGAGSNSLNDASLGRRSKCDWSDKASPIGSHACLKLGLT